MPFWKSSMLYKKIFSEGDFPWRCYHSKASEYRSRKALAQRPRPSTGQQKTTCRKASISNPQMPSPVSLSAGVFSTPVIVPFVRNPGRKMKHPPGAIRGERSCCQEAIAAFSFTPKPLSLG